MKKSKSKTIYQSGTSATGGLFQREINALLPLILSPDSKTALTREIKENNLLRINAQTTRSKIVGEIKNRIKGAFKGFWDIYKSSSEQEQAILLLFLILKTKPLLYDFHFEVTIPAWMGSNREFEPYNYQMKIDEIGNEHENVRRYTESTRDQILKIYRRMLKEAGLLKDNKYIKPSPPLKSNFFFPFIENGEVWFLEACFMSRLERERIMNDFQMGRV